VEMAQRERMRVRESEMENERKSPWRAKRERERGRKKPNGEGSWRVRKGRIIQTHAIGLRREGADSVRYCLWW